MNIPLNNLFTKSIFIALLMLGSIGLSFAQDAPEILANSPYKAYQSIYDAFFKARNQEMDSEDNADLWKQSSQNKPDDLLIKAYLASSIAMIGRDSWMPWNKIKYVEEGIRLFDQIDNQLADQQTQQNWLDTAGFTAPALFDIWYVQAQTLLSLPNAIFKTHSQGRELLSRILSHERFSDTTDGFQQEVNESAAKHL